MSGQATARVRMYRQGLGDCLLLSLLRPEGKPFHMMFDCGVILGTENAGQILNTVMTDIIAETGGQVDVLVVTHEHYDHVAGFKLAADRFAPSGAPSPGRLSVGEVWYAWTEDPKDKDAIAIRADRQSRLNALAQTSAHLALGADTPAELVSALGFFGVDADGKGVGDTAKAMDFPRSLVPAEHVRYVRPGQMFALPASPELRFFVLGPPLDRASLMKTDSVPEVYHVDGDQPGIQPGAPQPNGDWRPFDAPWSAELSDLMDEHPPPGALTDFVRSRYFGPATSTPATDVSWRRIDDDWRSGTAEFALALDSATNNTSVALAIEVVATGEVLLFPADAQVGNWLSWHGLKWQADGKEVTTPDLLSRTVFYKVGHHGSGNATLKAKGLEMMTSPKLVAFIPVDHEMAVKKRWGNMPLPSLTADLHDRCNGRVVRIDDPEAPAGTAISGGGKGEKFSTLFYEWSMPLALILLLLAGFPGVAHADTPIAAPDFTGVLYDKSFKALFILFILAVLVENGLALLFRWRPFLSVFDARSVNPVVSFGFSLVFVLAFHLDIVTGLLNLYADEHWTQNWPGSILTAMIVAGGSGAVNRLFRAFGLRLPASEELATPKPPPGTGWIAVTLAPASRAVGTVAVLISPANTNTVAGTIDAGAHGLTKFTALFLRNARRFPRNGGHSVKSGESYTVSATGRDANNTALSASWGPYTVDNGAVIDIELNPV